MKQKQIEEIIKIHCQDCGVCENCKFLGYAHDDVEIGRIDCIDYFFAEAIYNAGYRKIPENAVVLTREEYEELQVGNDFNYGYHSGESNMTAYYENIRLPEIRKETAEKFAERLKEMVAERNCNDDYDWEDVQVDGQIFIECVDEIAKEIIGG